MSEKYQVRRWPLVRLNRIRRENSALQQDHRLYFFAVDNEILLCYAKTTADNAEIMLVVANPDPLHTQSGWVALPLDVFELDDSPYQVHDLLTGARFLWIGARNYVGINPQVSPAIVSNCGGGYGRTEHDFDYFL